MNWLITTAVFVILIVVCMIFFFFMPTPQLFFDCNIEELKLLKENHDDIENEAKNIKNGVSVTPIYGDGHIYSADFPVTYKIMQNIPNVRYIGIIVLKPKFQQVNQYGVSFNANETLRYFYCINQSAAHKSGIWIDGASKFFTNGEIICGDMSKEHALFNKNRDNNTVLLFMDIDRGSIKHGQSPNHDVEKDEIIAFFKKQLVVK
jgi:hypothetical protein